MSLLRLKSKLQSGASLSSVFGTITNISATTIEAGGLRPSIGDIVKLVSRDSFRHELGMVTEIKGSRFFISPFGFVEGFKTGDKVYISEQGMMVPVGEALLGRVVDPFVRPKDGKPPLDGSVCASIIKPPLDALKRGLIDAPFEVGIKTIDGLLTCGKGQKVGIFAGSGVGKSTLMGMIVRGSQAPVKVVALIGERGREVPEFIQKNLGGDLTNTVLVVATSDDSPLMRKYGAFTAMSIAEYFKDQGQDVLFLMDSVTRFAMAQREIGLALGEPPTSKGYPPSVLTLLPQLMERAGKEEGKGSITAFFTILVEGDDMSDPIADQSRSILDGHIVLSRDLADLGIYPPINIQSSASRVMSDVITPNHQKYATQFRRYHSMIKENEILLRIGAYQKGSDKDLDAAIEKRTLMERFMQQTPSEIVPFSKTLEALGQIFPLPNGSN